MPNSDFFRSLGLPKEMAGELDADARTTEAEAAASTTPFLYQYILEGEINPEATFVESNVDGSEDRTLNLASGTTDLHEMVIQINGGSGSTTVLNASMRHREDGDLGSIDFTDTKQRFVKLRWEADIERWRILERNVNFGDEDTASGPTGDAGGDLDGTYPNPSVAAITEQGGPASLPIGAIADGQFLKRVGTDIVGVAAPGGATFPSPGSQGLGSSGGTVNLAVRVTAVQPNDQTLTVPTPADTAAAHGLEHIIRCIVAADPGVLVTINFTAGLFNGQGTTAGVVEIHEALPHNFLHFVWDHSVDKWLLLTANFKQFA